MSDWPAIELGQLADFRNGLNYSAADNGAGLAVVGVSDFQDKSFVDFSGLAELDPSALSKPDALIRKHDIIFVRSNGNRELIGRSLLVSDDPPKPTSHSGFTIRLRFTDERADPRFFAYLLRGDTIRRSLSSQGGGTSINNLNQSILSRLTVCLPPLETQRRIAAILGAYDDLIEVNRRRVAVLEEMARGLFEEWFVRFRFPGHEAVPILDTPDGPLPQGWAVGPLGGILALNYGRALKADTRVAGPVAVYGSSGIVGSHNQALVDGPGVVLGRKGNVGSVIWAPGDFWPIDTTYYVETPLPLTYVHELLRRVPFQNTDAAVPGLNREYALSRVVVHPPIELVKNYGKFASSLREQALLIAGSNDKLAASRDLLLPRLISGQLSVTAAERELEDAA